MLIERVKRVSGFTLLEMVVAVGIFGILVVVSVPVMRTWICNVKVRSVSDALQNGLRLAQAESLRRSRQVVFSLTNSPTPNLGFTAVANGTYWAIYTIPSMTDGNETPAFIDSGVLSNSANVTINGQAAICFNSVGRLVTNSTGVVAVTNGPVCAQPTIGTPPKWVYAVNVTGADRPLNVQVSLGGQVHMCDPSQTLSSASPEGC